MLPEAKLKFAHFIKSIFYSIIYYPVSISFIFAIYFSYNDKTNLKKLKPKENISHFSGLNSPKLDLLKISNNSGDI